MMKKFLIALSLILILGNIWASPIDKETARIVATNFMRNKVGNTLIINNVITEDLNGQTSFYVVNFQTGGWVMVSADKSAVPVLGYNLFGEYKLEDEKPEAFIELITNYKEQIAYSKKIKSSNNELSSKWETLISGSNLKSLKSYTPGDQLLDVPGRGHVQWRQGSNNSGGCTPSYNAFCPDKGCDDYCDENALVGCGAVAMGQIMWYWQWPLSSSYRTYNWGLMPNVLTNSSSTPEGDEIANLLRDIGREDAADMTYWCSGTWTTVNKIEDAFKDKFNYKGVKKHVKKDWKYGSAWGDLLRSEIDNERPVFYRGDKSDLSTSKHFFVLDGYDATDPDFFWFNFGHGGQTYNNSRHYLNDITPAGTDFDWTKNQMAIVGISPTYTKVAPNGINIFDVSYSSVTGFKNEEAQQDIALPASGKVLAVENGGELILTAGNSITLKSGFHAKAGSKFTALINPDFTEVMDISVQTWGNVFTPNGDGYNDEYCIDIENANSWEFEAFDSDGIPVFQSAGKIIGDRVCLWDGAGAYRIAPWETYYCNVRFKNNYGRDLENFYDITAIYVQSKSANEENLSITNSFEIDELTNGIQSSNESILFNIYPNPSKGLINVCFLDNTAKNIKIYNSQGSLCYQKDNINEMQYKINLTSFANGLYIVYAEINNQVLTQKIILEK